MLSIPQQLPKSKSQAFEVDRKPSEPLVTPTDCRRLPTDPDRCKKHDRFQSFLCAMVMSVSLICSGTTWAESPVWGKDASHVDISAKTINPNRIIVKFKKNLSSQTKKQLFNNVGITRSKTSRRTGLSVLELTKKSKLTQKMLDALRKSGMVEYAEPDYKLHINVAPNDPRLSELWGLHNTGQSGGTHDADIDTHEAWDIGTGDSNIVVGVIDTGVDYTHADLASNLWVNPGEIPGNRMDDDGNGYVDDIYGIDCVNNDSDPFDDHHHGTHVAGTIGAVGNNAIGVVGVNWQVKIMVLKFLGADGSGWTSDAIECLEYANMMKTNYGINLKLTNNSWGGFGFSQALYETIEASGDAGMLFVAAAGNESSDADEFPSYPSGYDLPNIISVNATTRNDNLAWFSNWGVTSVDLGAPGQDILSTLPGNMYASFSGTSMATPHVAGAAALLWTQHPDFDFHGIKETLVSTVDPVLDLAGLVVSGGRLNLYAALSCDPNQAQLITSLHDGDTVEEGIPVVMTARLSACALLRGAMVTADFSNAAPSLTLRDDGAEPDRTANDGLYTASWRPQSVGRVTITFQAEYHGTTFSTGVNSQVLPFEGYYHDDSVAFNWIEITGSGTPLNLADDDYASFPIPFPVTFYAQPYNQISVGSNGLVYFAVNEFGNSYENLPIPSTIGDHA
ncbi:MAG: S8 family serine peptidase, partial [Candidatus Tectomicrobia bacterium]|nr:S8 family serine peptidase [Candidatus Tectomicrobia bacterium]